jgi:hypothetical protein
MSLQPPPVCNPDGIAWFLRHRDGVVHGPFRFGSLTEAARLGRIADDTEISHPDFTNSAWIVALELPEIADAAQVVRLSASPPQRLTAAAPRWSLGRCWPARPGMRLILVATLVWLLGMPVACGYAVRQSQQHLGSGDQVLGQPSDLASQAAAHTQRSASQQQFIANTLTWWTLLYALLTVPGVVLSFTTPSDRWRPDMTT